MKNMLTQQKFNKIIKFQTLKTPKTVIHSIINNYHFLDAQKETFRMHICKLLSHTGFRVNLHSIICQNFKKLLAGNRHHIWSLRDSNRIWSHKHLVSKQTLNHSVKLTSTQFQDHGSRNETWELGKWPHFFIYFPRSNFL